MGQYRNSLPLSLALLPESFPEDPPEADKELERRRTSLRHSI